LSDRPILLDTHAALWLASGGLTSNAVDLLAAAVDKDVPILVSPITAWELGILVARGRVALPSPPGNWLDEIIATGASWAPLTPSVLIDASFLPGAPHRDPADRILAATARAFGFRLMTRDRKLLAYAEAGHLQAVAC
jgi:PIN domain nuclease of toxin-antitoxin system